MLSILLTACSTGTSAVATLQDNGARPPRHATFEAAGLGLPEASACDWPTDDPGDLVATGAEPGDVAAEMSLWDQCQEPLSSWDLYGRYVLVFSTTDDCADCEADARSLSDDADRIAASAGVELVPVVAVTGRNETPRTAGADYAERLGLVGFPVAADPAAASVEALPWDGRELPGRCLIAPDMVILGCVEGTDWSGVIEDWITVDAADR